MSIQLSTTQRLKNAMLPSLLSGAIGGAVYYFMYNTPEMGAIKVPFGPIELTPFMAVGGAVAAGTLVGELSTQFVLPWVQGSGYQAMEEFAIPPALAGVGSVAAMKLLIGGDEMLPIFLLGAGSSVGAKYIYGGFEGNRIVA